MRSQSACTNASVYRNCTYTWWSCSSISNMHILRTTQENVSQVYVMVRRTAKQLNDWKAASRKIRPFHFYHRRVSSIAFGWIFVAILNWMAYYQPTHDRHIVIQCNCLSESACNQFEIISFCHFPVEYIKSIYLRIDSLRTKNFIGLGQANHFVHLIKTSKCTFFRNIGRTNRNGQCL